MNGGPTHVPSSLLRKKTRKGSDLPKKSFLSSLLAHNCMVAISWERRQAVLVGALGKSCLELAISRHWSHRFLSNWNSFRIESSWKYFTLNGNSTMHQSPNTKQCVYAMHISNSYNERCFFKWHILIVVKKVVLLWASFNTVKKNGFKYVSIYGCS